MDKKIGIVLFSLIAVVFLFLQPKKTISFEEIDISSSNIPMITALDLAEKIIEQPHKIIIFDARKNPTQELHYIKNIMQLKPDPKNGLIKILNRLNPKKEVIFIAEKDSPIISKSIIYLQNRGVISYKIAGGYSSWIKIIINPELPQNATLQQISYYKKSLGISNFLKGENKKIGDIEKRVTPKVFIPVEEDEGDEGC